VVHVENCLPGSRVTSSMKPVLPSGNRIKRSSDFLAKTFTSPLSCNSLRVAQSPRHACTTLGLETLQPTRAHRNLIPVFENPLQHSSTHNANSLQHGQLDFDLGLSKPPVTMFPSSDGRMSFKHVGKRFKKQTFANIFGIIFLCGWVVLSSRVGDAGNKRLLG
jgi:hypothetical protein